MRIEHIAIWTADIEKLRQFYCTHFGCTHGLRYENNAKGFASYFLTFSEGARLEIMQKTGLGPPPAAPFSGLAHFALSTGSENAVRALTDKLRAHGVPVLSEPRRTGDGYYESVISDPDGNSIELTI